MPILNLQRTMRQLGRIRMGNKVAASNGRERPNKLETWRLTSPFKESLDVAAGIYGGTVSRWDGAPVGEQWELITETDRLDVIVPPSDMAFSQWMEMWSGGGCMRRCDQQIEQLSGEPCMCPADPEQRIELAGKGQACKPTTRLSVMQPSLPDIGLWRLETHGWYGAIELSGTIEILRQASVGGALIPARLTIEQRQVKRGAETRNFAVPVLELPTLTANALLTGEVPAQLASVQAVAELEAAIPTAPEPAAVAPAPVEASKPAARTRKAAEPAGDGGAFVRAIRAKARTKGIDDETLDVICIEATGVALADMPGDPGAANKVLEALDQKAKVS